jgi:hypothetical protein
MPIFRSIEDKRNIADGSLHADIEKKPSRDVTMRGAFGTVASRLSRFPGLSLPVGIFQKKVRVLPPNLLEPPCAID